MLCAAGGANAESKNGFRFDQAPSLRFGKTLRIDFKTRIHGDFSSNDERPEGVFDLHRARVGIEGQLFKRLEFEVERELTPKSQLWKDAFLNFRASRALELKGGRFKIPFSLDQLTPISRLPFVYRSRIADELSSGRDLGVMAHGRLFKRGLNYQMGVFRADGDNARTDYNLVAGGPTTAGRVTTDLSRVIPLPRVFRTLELGSAFTLGSVNDGKNGLRGRAVSGETFFPRMYVAGRRLRWGAEMVWSPGPLTLQAEFIHVRDERKGQALDYTDLSPVSTRGWYGSAVWKVAGKRREKSVELTARLERIHFGSAEHPGRPSRSRFAANILPNADRVWTVGSNWWLNRYVQIQANAIHERTDDPLRTPVAGRRALWLGVCRLQFVM